jgi:hypothetical protein
MRRCRHSYVGAIALAGALMTLTPTAAAAQGLFTDVSAVESFDPYNIMERGAVGAFVDPGTVTCPDAEPTGNPMQPCPAGAPIRLRGVKGDSRLASDSPLIRGWLHWELNANFDATGAGPAWGRFRIELDYGGVWEGRWASRREFVENAGLWMGHARWAARGHGGPLTGMHLSFTEVALTQTLLPLAWVAPVEATIVAPPRR